MSELKRSGSSLRISGPMRYSNAALLRSQGQRAILAEDVDEIDLAAVTEADSSALAVLFSWLRDAKSAGSELRVVNSPAGLLSLAALYGVEHFLPLA